MTSSQHEDEFLSVSCIVLEEIKCEIERRHASFDAFDLASTQDDEMQSSLSLTAPVNRSASNSSLNNSYEVEINRLRELIKQKEADYAQLEARLNESEAQTRLQHEHLNKSYSLKVDEIIKKFNESQKDKNSMVMKYVEAEKKCIELHRSVEFAHSKLGDNLKEKQRLLDKIEKMKSEIDKLNAENDKKLKELIGQKKECEKLKEQYILSDVREKAAQLKFKNECELHLNTRRQLEHVQIELRNIQKSQQEQPVISSHPVEFTNHTSETTTIVESTTEITKPGAPIVTPKPTEKDKTLSRELMALKSQLKDMFEERITLRDRLQCLEQERKLQEISLGKYKETLQSQKLMNKDLLDEILQLRETQETLNKEQLEKKQLQVKLNQMTNDLNELDTEMKQNKDKQNELLAFTSKLTEKNTKLQSENTILNEKLQSIEADFNTQISSLKKKVDSLQLEVGNLREKLTEQLKLVENLSKQLAEKMKLNDELNIKLSDERDENASLKKKHAANIKDLTRQLQTLQKKNAVTTTAANLSTSASIPSTPGLQNLPNEETSKMPARMSRESSISSLTDNHKLGDALVALDNDDSHSFSLDSNHSSSTRQLGLKFEHEVLCDASNGPTVGTDVYVVDIDKQKLIDKIVKLQKKLAKTNEKIDFLQDHINQLTNDLKRKTRIIQSYAIKEDAGTFTSEAQDAIKREMSKKTGIMSALYNTNKTYAQTANFIKSHESNMTMELSLEINAKLQALLEDTLIKNITLKESLETLGHEIARLSQENRQIKMNK